ncbi:hypothetical protein ABH926_002994 [Catenulispora sp. GP43]|uniref:hypothetical protein n=1 Tax=Catenulispora sp. GP43 TaxID=3156263 RepID=UPI003519CBF8
MMALRDAHHRIRQYVTDLDRATKGVITGFEAIGPQWGAGLAEPGMVHYRDGYEFAIAYRRGVRITLDVRFAAGEVTASAWVAENADAPDPEADESDEELVATAGPLTATEDAAVAAIIAEVVASVLANCPFYAQLGVAG